MFAFMHSAQEEGWRLEGDVIATYTNPTFEQCFNQYSISIWGRIDIDIESQTYIEYILNIDYWI